MNSAPLNRGPLSVLRHLANARLSGVAALLAAALALPATAATTDNGLTMEVMAAPNLVVDSNVETPASYSPRAAHFGVKITNTSGSPLTDIYVKMGALTNTTTVVGTAGTYPVTTVPAVPAIGYSGTFSFTHEGGASDAARYIPTLAAGQSTMVYWLVSYPLLSAAGKTVTGAANVTSDDLVLNYDVWVQATEGGNTRKVYDQRHATCRNEISAAANKIWPNTTSKVPPEYLTAIETTLGWRPDPLNPRIPGAYVQEGIWYDLGNVGAGFDNDGDGLPDRNAWMQPVGDPSVYNALAARLVKCYGLVIVKLNDGTEQLIPFEDRLYFQNLPANNTGAIGLVYYEFIPLNSALNTTLTPYQEVASGYDNEKFNGDYGVVVGTVATAPPSVTLGKTATATAVPDGTVTYSLTTTNTGTTPYGWPAESLPVVMEDAIPTGTTFVANSATTVSNVTVPSGGVYTVYYSTDSGSTWTTTQPAAASVTRLRWVLDSNLAASATATVRFQVTVNSAFAGTSVLNTGILKSGTDTQVTTATASTIITGPNSVGDFVWADLNRDGLQAGETGIANITVSLYVDSDADGILDSGEPLYGTTTTASSGTIGSYLFSSLPDGKYIVVVNSLDTDLPYGSTLKAGVNNWIPVDLDSSHASGSTPVSVLTADWPFIQALDITKSVTPTTYNEGELVTYTLDLENHMSTVPAAAPPVQTAYVSSLTVNGSSTPANMVGAPDNTYGFLDWAAGADSVTTTGLQTFAATTGTISKVELVVRGYLSRSLDDDQLTIKIGHSAATPVIFGSALTAAQLNTLVGVPQDLVIDITSKVVGTWTWPQAQSLRAILTADKNPPTVVGDYYIDSISFRVTASTISSGTYSSTNTMVDLPLKDTYDPAKLQYVSASIAPDQTTPAGTLIWENLGPVNPGARKSLTVTFRALAPTDTGGTAARDAMTATNTITTENVVTGLVPRFASGLPAGHDASAVNVTINPAGRIGDTVFWDVTTPGYDPGDIYLNRVIVLLYQGTTFTGRTAFTDLNGYYEFTGLADGDYNIRIVKDPANDLFSLPFTPATAPTLPSGTNTTDNTYYIGPTVTINNTDTNLANDSNLIQDFGFDTEAASLISGKLFMDYNNNGVQDAGEEPLVGYTMTLSGTNTQTVVTDANGFYRFSNLTNTGNSTVTVTSPPASTSQTLDPDASVNNATTVTVALGNAYTGKNFAYRPSGSLSIGDTLFSDWNGNGTQDSGDLGIAGVTVNLYEDSNGDGLINTAEDAFRATATTDASGGYSFTGLAAGNYIVAVDTTSGSFPLLHRQTLDYDGVADDSAKVALSSSLTTVDFGYQPIGANSLGNLVWLDRNNDGDKDSDEAGIDGVTVQLYRSTQTPGTDTPHATTTTSGGGLYSFTYLPAGSWKVYIPVANFTGGGALLATPMSSSNTDPADNQQDSDDNGTQAASAAATISPTIVLTETENDPTVDFGFCGTVRIGDTVFKDLNANGVQDYNETGINGVTVNLYLDENNDNIVDGPAIATTTTATVGGDAGVFQFTGLAPNRYIVKVDTTTGGLAAMTLTADPDFDGAPTTVSSPGDNADTDILLFSGAAYTGADFGYLPPGSIGDFVWLDIDRDGVQDLGEPGIEGVVVRITDGGSNTYDVTTDTDGYWGQTVANGSSWTVSILASNFLSGAPLYQFAATYDAQSGTSSPDSSVPVTVVAGVVTVPSGLVQGNSGIDFGFALNGAYSLSGTVVIEPNPTPPGGVTGAADGGPNEQLIAGVEVLLYTGSGVTWTFIGSTFTDASGNYSFGNLPNGEYRVILATTGPMLDTAALTTTTANKPGVVTECVDLGSTVRQSLSIAGSSITDLDFAFNSTVDYDFGDLPTAYAMTTFAQDGARHVIPNGGATLYLGTVKPDIDANGQSSVLTNGDDLATDDEDGVTAVSIGYWADGAATVATGVSNATGGDIQVAVVGSGWLVGWIDWNHNNFFDANEMIVNQAVTTGTLAHGFDIPAGTITGAAERWLSRFRLFPAEPDFAAFSYVGAASGGEVEDHLFDKPAGGSIGDYVWNDENANGLQDAGEAGIANVKVELFSDPDGNASTLDGVVIATTYTDADGRYRFPDLMVANYQVRIPSIAEGGTIPATFYANPTFDPDGTLNQRTFVALASGQEWETADFGFSQEAVTNVTTNVNNGAIGDRVWIDANGNGVQDPGEPGLGGLTVTLLSPGADGIFGTGDDTSVTTVTDASGFYSFTGQSAGAYKVQILTPPTGYTQTGDPDHFGTTGLNDNQTTTPIVLGPGDVFVNADFGYLPGGSYGGTIGDRVWLDLNSSGTLNGSETGIPGVSVALIRDTNGNGLWDAGELIIASTVTDTTGSYAFTGVPVADGTGTDDYLVWVNDTGAVLSGLAPTYDSNGTTTANLSVVTNLTTSGDVLQDFGYRPLDSLPSYSGTGVIGDTIFLDRDGSSTAQADEGLEGVTVRLYDAAGTSLLATTVTDENGHYYFIGLADATYTVKVDTTTLPGTAGQLTNTYDPDTTSPGNNQASVVISSGNTNLAQDFGYRDVSNSNTIGGTIWNDTNADGTRSGETTGYAGVTVVIKDSQGDVVATTVTDAWGNYSFSGLPDGTFTVNVTDSANVLNGLWKSIGASPGVDNNSQLTPYTVTVSAGAVNTTADFGYYGTPASLGNFVWNDVDNNGIQDSGETGIAGVTVQLTITWPNAATTVMKTLTDSSGRYTFGNLLLDENYDGLGGGEPTYSLSIPTLPGTASPTGAGTAATDSNTSAGTAALVTKGTLNDTYDFGFTAVSSASISGIVYDDGGPGVTGVDNVIGSGDTLQAGAIISLYRDLNNDGIANPGELVTTTATAFDGTYSFPNLASGNYLVVETDPSGASSEWDASASGSLTDSKIAVTLSGTNVTGQNFLDDGATVAPISGTVYNDADLNLAFGGGDSTLTNVTVKLYADLNNDGAVDSGDVLIETQLTASVTGAYSFINLPIGNYLVVETDPSGYGSVTDIDGSTNGASVIDVTLSGSSSTGNNFLDLAQACPDTWAAWQIKWAALSLSNTTPTGNPDLDRYSNLIEYAFCLPPNSGIHKPFCLQPGVTGQIDGVFHRTAGGTEDTTYILEYTSLLGDGSPATVWSQLTLTAANTTVTINPDGTESVKITNLEGLTGLTGGEGFVRLRAIVAGIGEDTTEVLGWTETLLNQACSTFNNPYLRCSTFTGTVASIGGDEGRDLIFTDQNLTSLLDSGEKYYIEVTSGTLEGHRFDVVSTSGTNVKLAADSDIHSATAPFNTLAIIDPAPVEPNTALSGLVGAKVILRRHWTLGVQFPVASFYGAPSQDHKLSDQVQVFAGGAWSTYFVYDLDGTGAGTTCEWVKYGDATHANQTGVVLPPGQGMFVSMPPSSVQMLSYGELRDCDFIRPLQAGNNLVGGGFPIDQSARGDNSRQMNLTPTAINPFFGSKDFKTADSFFIWKGDATSLADGYDTYFLLSSASPSALKWVKMGDATIADQGYAPLLLFKSDRSVFIRSKDGIPLYTIPCPWAP